jgi:hypothetical protein
MCKYMCNNLLFDALPCSVGGNSGAAASNPQAWTCSWGGQLSSSDWPWPRVTYTSENTRNTARALRRSLSDPASFGCTCALRLAGYLQSDPVHSSTAARCAARCPRPQNTAGIMARLDGCIRAVLRHAVCAAAPAHCLLNCCSAVETADVVAFQLTMSDCSVRSHLAQLMTQRAGRSADGALLYIAGRLHVPSG